MGKLSDYKEIYNTDSYYNFNLSNISLSYESVVAFLKSRGYEIVSIMVESEDDRYRESTFNQRKCAIKFGENPDINKNEITTIFYKEYQEVLVSLLINVRDINYYEQLFVGLYR